MAEASDRSLAATTASGGAAPEGRHYGKWLLIAVVALVLIYLLSPYYSFWRFTTALRAGDRNQLETMVDFDSLRKSLKQQLRAKLASSRPTQPQEPKKDGLFGGLSADFGPRLIDTLVDAYVTPEGLAAFLVNPQVPTSLTVPPPESTPPANTPADAAPDVAPSTEPGFRSINWSSVRSAFFTGPREFTVDVQGTRLHYRFEEFRWQLKTVELEIGEIKL